MTSSRRENFWTTLPGLLTAAAAVITAIGGVIAVLFQTGIIGAADKKPAPPAAVRTHVQDPATSPVTTSPSTSDAPAGKPWSDVIAKITRNDGQKPVTMRAETLRYCIAAGMGIRLNDSLDIAFDKMSSIEVLRSDVALSAGGKATLRVTLDNGSVENGTISTGCDFIGQTDAGRYSLYPDKLAKIEFQR